MHFLATTAAALITVNIVNAVSAMPQDPWPFWGRTSERVSNTNTIGPRTPTIDWLIQFDFHPDEGSLSASSVMDRYGRLFVGTRQGVTALDSETRSVLWVRNGGSRVNRTPTVAGDRVFWGENSPSAVFHCSDAATGEDVWTVQGTDAMSVSPVVNQDVEMAYFSDIGQAFLARRISDGQGGWTTPLEAARSPSLNADGVLITGTRDGLARIDFDTGGLLWLFPTVELTGGLNPMVGNRVYVGTDSRELFAINKQNGSVIWEVALEGSAGAEALGHDGTIYSGHSAGREGLSARTPDGDFLWHLDLEGHITFAPVIDGEETIYATAWASSPREGWVHAFRADSSEVWTLEMPNHCSASPMLAPDGTLYVVCRDKNLYAFRDPHTVATLSELEVTTGEVLEGNIFDLNDVDNNMLRVRSGYGDRLSDLHKMEMTVNANIDEPNFDILRIQLKTWIDYPTGIGTVELKNWTTNEFETVRTYNLEDEPFFEWIQIPAGGKNPRVDPHRYVRLSGEIELRITHVVFVPLLAFTFETALDQVKIEVTGQ